MLHVPHAGKVTGKREKEETHGARQRVPHLSPLGHSLTGVEQQLSPALLPSANLKCVGLGGTAVLRGPAAPSGLASGCCRRLAAACSTSAGPAPPCGGSQGLWKSLEKTWGKWQCRGARCLGGRHRACSGKGHGAGRAGGSCLGTTGNGASWDEHQVRTTPSCRSKGSTYQLAHPEVSVQTN